MVSKGELSGVLYLTSSSLEEPFVEEDLELVTAAATLLGLTIESLDAARHQREMFFGALRTLVALSEAQDPGRRGHSERVSGYAHAIARELGLAERERVDVRLAALLHDIGRAGVPPDAVDSRDTRRLKRGDPGTLHAEVGARLAESVTGAEGVPPAIRHHHEAFDGSGYPDGLAGEAIPLTARIVATADLLDHLARTGGAEGGAAPLGVAVELLDEHAGRELDPEVARACAAAYRARLLDEEPALFGEPGAVTAAVAQPDAPEGGIAP
jgi:putative nucleotidyltransferase with HDIG domain